MPTVRSAVALTRANLSPLRKNAYVLSTRRAPGISPPESSRAVVRVHRNGVLSLLMPDSGFVLGRWKLSVMEILGILPDGRAPAWSATSIDVAKAISQRFADTDHAPREIRRLS
jgi:hypothetical protein